MNTQRKVSVKQAPDVDATNAYAVTVTDNLNGTTWTATVHTDKNGRGLWADGQQVEGQSQFSAGKNPAAAIRRYFS